MGLNTAEAVDNVILVDVDVIALMIRLNTAEAVDNVISSGRIGITDLIVSIPPKQ